MRYIIKQLQEDLFDPNISTSALLLKASVLAHKLLVNEFKQWIANELNGYDGEIPKYRCVQGQLKARDPYGRLVPILFSDAETNRKVSVMPISDSISKIEQVSARSEDRVHFSVEKELESALMADFHLRYPPVFVIHISSMQNIITTVRNNILNWILKLETDGVLGQELTFEKEEREKVTENSYRITNSHYYGSIKDSQIAGDGAIQNMSKETSELDQIRSFISEVTSTMEKFSLNESDKAEIQAEIATVNAQLSSPKPKKSIMNQSLMTIRSMLEGCAGSLLANEITRRFATLFM